MLQGKEKKEKYREATRLQVPTELPAPRAMHKHQTMPKHHKWCRRQSKRCAKHQVRWRKHLYDAQSITCDAQASARCHKHQV